MDNKINSYNFYKFNNKIDFKKNKNQDSTLIYKNQQINETFLNNKAILGKTQITFKGNKFNLNKKDILFISSLASTLGISASQIEKIKDIVSNFLQEKNFSSMGDFGGEEHIDEQSELEERISKSLNIENDSTKREFIAGKIIDRCDEGENYYPSSETLEDYISEIEALKKELKENIKNTIISEQKKDSAFINAICHSYEFNEHEKETLTKIIKNTLYKNNLIGLGSFKDDKLLETQAAMQEKIYEELDIPEELEIILDMELENRIFSNKDYHPITNPIDKNPEIISRDIKILDEIMHSYNIKVDDRNSLLLALKEDAYQHKFKGIFDLFSKGKDIKNYKNLNNVLNSENFLDIKNNLLIDLFSTSKNLNKIEHSIENKELENSIKNAKANAILCKLDKEFIFTEQDILKLKKYLTNQNLDSSNDIWKAAYEISSNYSLEGGAEKKIVEIIKSIDIKDEDDITQKSFDYIQLLKSKQSN